LFGFIFQETEKSALVERLQDQAASSTFAGLQEKYGSGTKAELMAIKELKGKNLNQQQINKYYSYLSRNGNNINTASGIVAGLPNGDKKFSCEYIGVK